MKNCIVTVVKNEQNLLVDFLVHHLHIGFDEIHLFDDGSDPAVRATLADSAPGLLSRVVIHRIDQNYADRDAWGRSVFWDEHLFEDYRTSKQLYLYNLAVDRFLGPSDWAAFIDVDEFLFLGDHGSIAELRASLMQHSFDAIVFDQLLYGHGFHLTPPADDNACAYLWCAESYYGHGKFFARCGAIARMITPHIPEMTRPGAIADGQLQQRASEFYPDMPRTAANEAQLHLKHLIIQSVSTCFERRLRSRIGSMEPMCSTHPSWVDRTRMLDWTTRALDLQLASAIIRARKEHDLPLETRLRALTTAASLATDRLSSRLDYNALRRSMGLLTAEPAELLFAFFSHPAPQTAWLRFVSLPEDFRPEMYQSINSDLASLSRRAVIEHYVKSGISEHRRYNRLADAGMP